MTKVALRREARELQAFVDQLHEDGKPSNVVDGFIAGRRREAARETGDWWSRSDGRYPTPAGFADARRVRLRSQTRTLVCSRDPWQCGHNAPYSGQTNLKQPFRIGRA
jgi:hypothetical protein